MRCKKHPADVSSAVGVCASCLRERLFALMAAQAEVQVQVRDHQNCRKLDTQLPSRISFPRPDTHAVTWQPDGQRKRFYSTPLVGPTGIVIDKKKKSNGGKLSSLFLGLFRSRSDIPDSESGPDPGVMVDSCTASPLWFSAIIPGGRRKQTRTFSLDESTIRRERKLRRDRDRGMSPAICSEDEDDGPCRGGSSGYSSESSQGWRQTPRRTPATVRRTAGHSRNVSGLAFCLSPLVRASPNRQWNQKAFPPEMVVVTRESRAPPKAHLPSTASFCKNRSRKLADFGRKNCNTRRH